MSRSRRAVLKGSGALAFAGWGCLGADEAATETPAWNERERIRWGVGTETILEDFVVTNELVFVLTWTHLIAVNPSGEREWSIQLDEMDDTQDYEDALAADDSGVFVSGTPETAAYDHAGDHQWGTDSVHSFDRMAVDGNHLYVAQRGIYALDRATGAVEWEAFREGPADPTPPAAYDGTVYVGLDDGRCAALAAADGTVRWTQDTGVYAAGMPIERDGRVYVGGHYASTDDGVVLALNPGDGVEQWRTRTGSVLADRQPVIADGTVYIGTSSGHLHAHDRATGDEEWTFAIEENSVSNVSPPAVGSSVYTKGYGEYLYAIEPASGEEEWRVALGRGAVTPTFVDGTLLAASTDGLFAVETDAT